MNEPKKILIVEDERPLLKVLQDKFTSEGFSVIAAVDGVEGLEATAREHPDIILLDIIMPRMDGMTMLKKLKEDASFKNIPVLVLTNLSDDLKVAQLLSMGAFDYLVKSDWKLEDVVAVVREKLQLPVPQK